LIEKLSEQTTLWETLQQTEKPIFLYGMGDGADKILKVLDRYGISIAGVYASDEFVRGHSFHGFEVRKFSEVCARYGHDFITLLAFGTFREPLLSTLYERSEEYEFYAPDVPVCVDDETLFTLDYIREHEADFDAAFALLADDASRSAFLDTLNFKVSGKPQYLKRCTTPLSEGYDLLHLQQGESYIDLGAYTGDTVELFLRHTGGRYRSVLALEPDAKNLKKMLKRFEALGVPASAAVHAGSWSEDTTLYLSARAGRQSSLSFTGGKPTPMAAVDHLVTKENMPVTFIKIDVEGAEAPTLLGLRETISRDLPKMLLSAYHRNQDLWLLPKLADDLSGHRYRFYFRHHPYLPAWDNNFYLLPKE